MQETTKQMKSRLLVTALLLELSSVSSAANIIADGNTCSLVDAITAANTNSATGGCIAGNSDDVIELPANSNVTLNTALPDINTNVTINGNNSSISRDGAAPAFPIINIVSQASVTLNNLTISNGLDNNNYGAGVRVFDAQVVINDSTIENNIGGAVNITRSIDSEINNSTIINNSSAPLSNFYNGGLTLNSGSLTITNSTISNNDTDLNGGGGGIYATNYFSNANLSVINSTISGNSSTSDGGGIKIYRVNNSFTLTANISNTTIVANNAGTNGGGIGNDGATVTVSQTIVSGNSASSNGNSIFTAGGSMTLNDYNLLGLDSNDGLSGVVIGANDLVPIQTNLSDVLDITLANNGGNTPTHNLVSSSPAVDAIPVLNCANINDQRGIMRGNDGNGDSTPGCDIGAVEFISDVIFVDGFDGN